MAHRRSYVCMRCKRTFATWRGLQTHSRKHFKKEALDEIKLLEKGCIPSKSKIGSGFKGKNRVIIT